MFRLIIYKVGRAVLGISHHEAGGEFMGLRRLISAKVCVEDYIDSTPKCVGK